MKRSGRLRSDPEKVQAWQRRSRKALPAESSRRRGERQARAGVRERAPARAGWRCEAIGVDAYLRSVAGCTPRGWPAECSGGLEVHEVTRRSVRPGSHLDDDQTMVLCSAHHRWVTENPLAAHDLGLARWSWENRGRNDGEAT